MRSFLTAVFVLLPLLAGAQPAGEVRFESLSAGNSATCGLTKEGRAYCWGSDEFGQLGIGGAKDRCDRSEDDTGPCARTPAAVLDHHVFVAISVGQSHTCAVDNTGSVYCWGQNHFGELGIPEVPETCVSNFGSRRPDEAMRLACSRRPLRVPLEKPVASITTGERISCALDTEGQAWCWGSFGRPGTISPVGPQDVKFTSISAGGTYVCGLTAEGRIHCWIYGGVDDRQPPPPATSGWRSVSAGTDHACGLDAAGRAHCWGSDADGALGRGPNPHDRIDWLASEPVSGGHTFRTLVTGTIRTCGIDETGALFCWGRVAEASSDSRCLDSNGIAGTNDCTTRPSAVQRSVRFRALTIGAAHQCGLTVEGLAVCWGVNNSGEVGDGSLRSTHDAATVRTAGISATTVQLLDARDRISWLWTWRGAAVLAAIGAAIAGVRPFRRWWDAGEPAAARALGADLYGRSSVLLVAAGWVVFLGGFWSASTARGGGEVGYGLMMMALLTSYIIGMALALAGLGLAIVGRRNRRSPSSLTGLVLSSVSLLAAAAAAWMFLR